jgi:1-acyl-sn-glycerol-3-phosphate acyltransferase
MRAPASGDPLFRAARAAAGLLTRWHRAELAFAERLPDGPALLVGNHGLFGLETPVFFWLLREATGRHPWGLADRVLFGNDLVRPLLERVGGVVGTPANAARLLAEGNLVVCYPGGAREVFKRPSERYQLQWEGCLGFARVAIAAQVPIVPFAGLGVDDGYVNFGRLRAATALLGRYAAPLALGLGPLPLPSRLRFVLGRPIVPPSDPDRAPLLKAAVERSVRQLLASKGTHAVSTQPARVVP